MVTSPTTGGAITRPEQLNAAVAEAFAAGDVDAFLDLHTPDATTTPPPDGVRIHGIDAIRAAVGPIVATKPRLASTVTRVVEGDGIALTHARWVMTATGADGTPVESRGRGTIVSLRLDDGTWRILIDDPLTPD